MGSIQLSNGRISDAEETFSKIIKEAEEKDKLSEITPEIHEKSIDCLISLNKTEQATEKIDKIIDTKKQDMEPTQLSRLYSKQSSCYQQLGEYRKSEESMNKNIEVLEVLGDEPVKLNESYFSRSKLRSNMGDEKGSLKDLNQLIETCKKEEKIKKKEKQMFAEDEKAYFYRMKGMILKKTGKYEKAIEVFRKSRKIVRKSLKSYDQFQKRKKFDLSKEEFRIWAENEMEFLQIQINDLIEKEMSEEEDEEEESMRKKKKIEFRKPERSIKEIRMAFISHVSDYGRGGEDERENLSGTKHDFEGMYGYLSKTFDYVQPLSDDEATKVKFMDSFRRFLEKRMEFVRTYPDRKIVTLFYYSGHGYYNQHAILELRNDDEIEIEKLKFLLRSENSINIFILDCCQNYRRMDLLSVKKVLKPMDVYTPELKFSNNLICLSQEPGMCAIARKNDTSVYTEIILRYLLRKNFNLEYLLKNVKKDVVKFTRRNEKRRGYVQNPWYQSDLFEEYIWNRTEEGGMKGIRELRRSNLEKDTRIMDLQSLLEEKDKKIRRLEKQRSEIFDYLMSNKNNEEEEEEEKDLFHIFGQIILSQTSQRDEEDDGDNKIHAWWIEGEEDEKIRRKNKKMRKVKVRKEPVIPSRKFMYSKDLKVTDVIGKGGQCSVYLCEVARKHKKNTKLLGKSFAYKEFKSPNEMYVEAMGMCNLKHPNILSLVGYCFSKKSMGLVLEYCSKGDLFQYMEKAKEDMEKKNVILPLNTRFRFLMEIVDSLDYLHHTALVFHRDLKLQNILVSEEEEEMKLMDFGLCRKISQTKGLYGKNGSPKYMAPEILNGQQQTQKVDIYSFGMIFYCILMISTDPFEEFENDVKMIEEKVKTDPNFKPFINHQVIPMDENVQEDDKVLMKKNTGQTETLKELIRLMDGCWSYEPDKRSTFEVLQMDIQKLLC